MYQDRSHVVASGFLALLASQIGTRVVTFTINLLIARHLSPEAYGLSSVQFHLLITTALFISREGFRRGCLRFGAGAAAATGNDHSTTTATTSTASGSSGVAASGIDSASRTRTEGVSQQGTDSDGGGDKGPGAAGPSRPGGVDSRSVLRVAVLVVPWGALVTAGVCGLALWRRGGDGGGSSGQEAEVPWLREAVVLHGIAAMIELLAEPFYILASVNLKFGPRVAIEFASTLTKSLVTLALLAPGSLALLTRGSLKGAAASLPPALLFSVAQLALAAVVLAGYTVVGLRLMAPRRGKEEAAEATTDRVSPSGAGAAGSGGRDGGGGSKSRPGPSRWLAPWSPLERQVLGTSALFTLQAVEKLALAEGSKVVLATMQSAINQGVYGLVSNLGSLVVRTLFQPLEEAAFAAFSTWGAEATAAADAEEAAAADAAIQQHASEGATAAGAVATAATTAADATARTIRKRGGGAAGGNSGGSVSMGSEAAGGSGSGSGSGSRLAPLARALAPMVKGVTVLGLLAAALGPSYSYVLLRLVYGVRWSETEAPAVLGAYSVYVLLLALNGIGEAFSHAVLDARGLHTSNALLLLFSGAHLGACVALVRRYGAIGLVAADGANMVLRIAFSAWCIRRFFRPLSGFSVRRDLLPAPTTLAAFLAAAAAAAASNRLLLVAPGTDGATPQRLFLRRAGLHVAVGVVLVGWVLAVTARTERAAIRQVLELRRRRRRGRGQGGSGQGGPEAAGEPVAADGGVGKDKEA